MEQPLEIPVMSDLTMVLGSISQVTFFYVCLSFTKLEILQTFGFWYTCWWDSGSQKQEQSSLISQMLQQFMTMWNRFDIHENILSSTHVPKATVNSLFETFFLHTINYQATAFGMRSVVYVPHIQLETVSALSAFCDKASMVSTGWELIYIWMSFLFILQ